MLLFRKLTMPVCPHCDTEYEKETDTCPTCQRTHPAEYGDWSVVESVPNELVGNILQSVLAEDGIPVYLRPHDVPYYGGVKGNAGQSEWGDLLVPLNLRQQAQQCLKTYLESLQEDES